MHPRVCFQSHTRLPSTALPAGPAVGRKVQINRPSVVRQAAAHSSDDYDALFGADVDARRKAARLGQSTLRKALAVRKLQTLAAISILSYLESEQQVVGPAVGQFIKADGSAHVAQQESALAPPAPPAPPSPESLNRLHAALLTDEVRWLETQYSVSKEEAAGVLGMTGHWPDLTGSEFDPLSCELESSKEVVSLKKGLTAAILEHAELLARLEASAVPGGGAQPASGGKAIADVWAGEVKKLQARWAQLNSDILHLQVLIAQQRQLPGTPKRRITLATVREQQVRQLEMRQAALRQRTAELRGAERGMGVASHN